ncbi:MAG TPA: hypothetical protein VFW19_03870 [Allosphingosinicella sp.]|nr:hypothetical protein [Allosphingosinicella sp.]
MAGVKALQKRPLARMSADFGTADPAFLTPRPRGPPFSPALPLYLDGRMDAMSSFYAPDGFGANMLDRPWAGSMPMQGPVAPPRDARPRAPRPASASPPPGPAPASPAPPKPAQDSKAHDKLAKDQAKAKGKKADDHEGGAAGGRKKGAAPKGGKPKGKVPAGKGRKGGGKHGHDDGKIVELIFVHDRKEPVTGPPDPERRPLHIEVDSSSFSAPRSLPFGGVRQKQQPGEAPRPVERDYRSLYADAAEASFQLYRQLDEGARRLADEAESNMRRIADRHADAIEENLGQLDSDLERQRAELAMGRETALADLHDGASALRTKVQGATARALGRLDALYHHYLDAMSGPEAKRATIESRSGKAVGDLAKNSQDAVAKLNALSGDQSPVHVKEAGPWVAPANEAIDAKLPERAAEEVERFQKMITDVQKPLEKMDHCLPCRFTMAFAGIRAKAANVHEAGPNAILSARDGAIESIENSETQLEDMIERSAASTDDALVKQHDAARARAIESAKAEAAGESVRLEGAARMQVRTLTAMSIAQPEALQRVVDRLAEEKQRPEQDFGRMAASAADRLRGSIAASAARQPGAARDAFVQTIGGLDTQAMRFDLGIARSVADTAKAGGEMVANSLQSFRTETDKGLANLKSLPGSITTQCAHYLDPVDDGYEKAGKELSEAVDSAGAEVEAMITGKAAPAGKKEGKGGGDKGDGKGDGAAPGAPAAPAKGGGGAKAVHVKSSLGAPPPKVRIPAGGGAPAAGRGQAAAPPANCAGCNDEAKPAAGKKEEKPSGGDDNMSVEKMIELAGNIARDVLADPPIKEFQGTANQKVIHTMEGHANKIDKELGSFFPNGDLVVSELRGTTTIQGIAYRHYPALAGEDGLDERIKTRLWDGWAMPGTIKANIRAALAALDGSKGDAAFADLEAAFNWSDQNDRSEQALLNLSPPELEALRAKHGDDLKKMAADLSGADRKKFEALIGLDADGKWLPAAEAAANYNGIKLQEGIKSARDTEGEAGWDKAGEAIGDASRSAGSSRLAGNDDMFGIGSGKKREANDKAQWEATQIAYGKVTGAVAAPTKDGKAPSHADQLAAAQTGMIKQATETITHHHHVSDPEGGSMDWDTVDTVGDRHKLWIERIVKTGPDSNETRAARLGIEFNRQGGKPTRDGLDKALHFGSADAVENGHYDEKARAAGEAKAKADQDEVLKIYAQDELDRESAKDGVCKENKRTAEEIRADLKEKAAKQFGDDTKGKKDALGILSSPHGDALATIELAISSEKKEIAIKQLQRMDAKEIKKLSDDYAAAHPGEKSLEAQLGINGHHWNWHNWNGATFSGDAANEIEIAFMGVPQNPKERGEVALRVMDQQIDQAGWLGKLLAHDDFDKLKGNAASLRKLMGVTEADVDSSGRIVAHDPQTGLKLKWGNFDENGDFVPPKKGDASAFERAIALSRITADNYVASVDKIANFVATALVVIAAVVTTALTGGAAASIWIPVLVTAAAGVAGMGLKMAIKGGRYSRDEMVTDLVSTIVQAATAGIGAAAGAALRGGAPALKALAGTMKMSEQALGETVALAAGKSVAEATAMRSLSLAEEVAIGAGTSALSGGATAAFDPAARRDGDYWGNIFHSMGRGALGGGLGALGGRAGAKGFEFLSKRLGSSVSQTAMKAALAAGKSEAEAIRAGEEAVAKHWATEIGTRAFSSGASGMASRGGELMYDKNVRGMDISYGEMFREMGEAGLQNFIQGAGEGAADRGMRAISPRRAAEHEWVQQHPFDHPPPDHGGADPGVEIATELAAASHIPAEKPAAPPPEPAKKPQTPREADTTARKLAREAEESPAAARRRAADGDEKAEADPIVARTEDEPGGKKTLVAANDNPGGPTHVTVALSEHAMLSGPVAEGSVFVHPDSKSLKAANDNFDHLVARDPTREAAIYHNPETGEYIVIQGDKVWVAAIVGGELKRLGGASLPVSRGGVPEPGGHWILHAHYHPNREGEVGTRLMRRLPSGKRADFSVIIREATAHGHDERVSRIYFIDNGERNYTDFGYNKATGAVWVDYPEPGTGVRTRKPFASLDDYQNFLDGVRNDPERAASGAIPRSRSPLETEAPAGFRPPGGGGDPSVRTADVEPPPALDPALRVGGDQAALSDPLSPANRGDVARVSELIGEAIARDPAFAAGGKSEEEHYHALARVETPPEALAIVRAMGLVDRPDSMIRLAAILNDPQIRSAAGKETGARIARAVLDANREAMIADGRLQRGEELMMFFHGADAGQLESYRKSGIDMTKVGQGDSDDVGRGLYMSQDYRSGLGYVKEGGALLPWMAPRGELGNIIDIRPGSPLRARWEQYVLDHPGPSKMTLVDPANFDFRNPKFSSFRIEGSGRGDRFDDFVRSLANDESLPPELRAAARDPHLLMSDLGGPVSWGNDRRFMTDQAAIRSQALADMMNEQLGFPHVGPAVEEEPIVAFTADAPAAAKKAPPQILPAHEDAVLAELAGLRNGGPAVAAIKAMMTLDRAATMAVMHAGDAEAPAALRSFRDRLVKGGMSPAQAEVRMRRLDLARAMLGSRFRIETRFEAGLTKVSTKGLSDKLARWVQESAVLDWFHRTNPKMFDQFHEDFLALDSNAGGRNRARFFTSYVVARLSRMDSGYFPAVGILKLDDAVIRMALREHQLKTQTDPLPKASAAKTRPNSHSGPKITDPEAVPVGLRVDTPSGRGTVKAVAKNGVARINLDPPSGKTVRVDVATGQLRTAREPNPLFDKDPPVHADTARMKTEFAEIDQHRIISDYPEYERGNGESGTVARLKLGKEVFYGTNSSLDPAIYSLPLGARREIFEQLRRSAGLKRPNLGDAQFVNHAEAEALIRGYLHYGALPEVVELFVDRPTCPNCNKELIRLARMLGVKELRIYYKGQSNPPLVRN